MAGWTVFRGRAVHCVALALVLSLSACSSAAEEEPIPPTRTLVPPTETPAVSPVPPTATPTDLPGPSSFAPAVTPVEAPGLPRDLGAALQQAVDDMAASGTGSPDRVRVLGIERFLWPDASLGCTTAAESETSGQGGGEGYRMLLAGPDGVAAYHSAGDALVRCAPGDLAPGLIGEPVAPDPIAEAMAQLVTRDWAAENGVSASEVELISLLSVTWPDTSLGCPKTGGVYAEQETPGYRVVVRTGEREAIYHTNIREFVLCAPGEEVLPDALHEALAPPETSSPD